MVIRTTWIVPGYAAAAVAALAWHALAVAWDGWGLFVQAILSSFALMAVAWVDFPTLTRLHRGICAALLVASCLLWFAYAYFAPQAVCPITITCLVLTVVWGRKKTTKSKLETSVYLALPLAGLLVYGCINTFSIYRLRHLSRAEVKKIELRRLAPLDQGGTNIQLNSESEVSSLLAIFSETTPYAPNHEGLNAPWQASILLNSGETIYVDVGKGTRANPNTCSIRLGVTSYQNKALFRFLQSLAPHSF